MSIVFVHGVNTRKGPGYDTEKEVIRRFLLQHFAGAKIGGKTIETLPRIEFPYWGDLGAKLIWDGRSVPRGNVEELALSMDLNFPLLFGQLAELTADDSKTEPLTMLAKNRLSLAVDMINDLVLRNVPRGRAADVADFVVRASTYADTNETPPWLATITTDLELISRLRIELERPHGIQAQGFEDLYNGLFSAAARLKQAVAQLSGTMLDRTGDFVSTRLLASTREPINAVLGRFFGDVFVYFNGRENRAAPGPIPSLILESLDEAQRRPAGEALVVIGHSLGGVIAFDLLGHFRPQLEVDLFVSVGSQVAHFEEMKLYRNSDLQVGPPSRATTPANIRRWINIYDRADIFAYAARDVFDRVHVDAEYDTRTYVIKSHSAYFQQNRFYTHLRERLKELS